VLETLRATVTELEKARDWNVGQVANWREEAEVRARTIESLKAAASELEQARERERHEAAAAAEVLRQEIERGRAREANLEARISADAAELAAARRRIDDLLKRGLVDRVLNRPL
jgi:chromosome segregation ATPase